MTVVGIASLVHIGAYLVVRAGHITIGAMLMISASLAQHVVIAAANQQAALVTPFFASIFVMIAATCIRRVWLWPVYLLATSAVGAQWFTGTLSGLTQQQLQGPYIAASVLTSITAVVAWLHTKGLERAIEVAQSREDEREQLFLELEKSARMEALGRLAGGIAHDFNNLLVVIQGSAELARDDLPDGNPAAEEIDQIQGAARRAAELTSQLLAFSRRQVVPTSEIRPADVLNELKPLLKRLLGSKMSLILNIEDRDVPVLASSTQLEQVLMNLAANARDASNDSGTLTIQMESTQLGDGEVADLPPGEYVEISVADEGSGIPAEVMDHLFEPFFTTKEVGRGTGLGLATSFGIIHQMGGIITVESEPGEGATFHIYIPVAQKVESPSLSRMPARGALEHALVIDDDPTVRQLVHRVLSSSGTHVLEADDRDSSIKAAEGAKHLDLIITDVVLSDQDGLRTLDKLKDLQPEARLVVMSSFAPGKEVLTALDEKGVTFLPKPFSNAALMAVAQGEPPPEPSSE